MELGTEPLEPEGLALVHVPDSEPSPKSDHQALVTQGTRAQALVTMWQKSRCMVNLPSREARVRPSVERILPEDTR